MKLAVCTGLGTLGVSIHLLFDSLTKPGGSTCMHYIASTSSQQRTRMDVVFGEHIITNKSYIEQD